MAAAWAKVYWPRFSFLRFYELRLRLGQLKRKKELNKANIPATSAEK